MSALPLQQIPIAMNARIGSRNARNATAVWSAIPDVMIVTCVLSISFPGVKTAARTWNVATTAVKIARFARNITKMHVYSAKNVQNATNPAAANAILFAASAWMMKTFV